MERRDILVGGISLGVGAATTTAGHNHRQTLGKSEVTGVKQLIFQDADGEHLIRRAGPMGGLPFAIKVDDRVSGARSLFIFTEVLAAGQMIPWHRHDTCEEVMLVEEGGVTITVAVERSETGPRSMAFMPQGVWHAAINASQHPVHLTSIYSGQDFAAYPRAISVRPGQPIVPINPDQLSTLRALGHATYWDSRLGAFPPGVAHP